MLEKYNFSDYLRNYQPMTNKNQAIVVRKMIDLLISKKMLLKRIS